MTLHIGRIEAIEDNGGGLYLAILDDDGACTRLFRGFGERGPSLQEEIVGAIEDGVDGWDGAVDGPAEHYAQLLEWVLSGNGGARIVAEWTEASGLAVYPERMGCAARAWARVTED